MSAAAAPGARVDFGEHVRRRGRHGLVVQPRMGMSDPHRMRDGLRATRAAAAPTVGTITIDSYTRVGSLDAVEHALRAGEALNGYPLASRSVETTAAVLDGLQSPDFPVQVRHGSAAPRHIFAAMAQNGLGATEGGPVSYCLPYGRVPLAESVRNWAECCELFAGQRGADVEPHLETFGGCLLGQLCPPSQLVATSVLEALFFAQHGIRSISVSYAQQTNMDQDIEAVTALRRLCRELLPVPSWHVVLYTYMGVYPTTPEGANRLLGRAAQLAVLTGSERIIVKTTAEAARIPTVTENVEALEWAARVGDETPRGDPDADDVDSQTYQEARALVHAVLDLDADDVGAALLAAFRRGYLDVPYCLHPDNAAATRACLDDQDRLRWADTGALPIAGLVDRGSRATFSSAGLLSDLNNVRGRFDCAPWAPGAPYGGDRSRSSSTPFRGA